MKYSKLEQAFLGAGRDVQVDIVVAFMRSMLLTLMLNVGKTRGRKQRLLYLETLKASEFLMALPAKQKKEIAKMIEQVESVYAK